MQSTQKLSGVPIAEATALVTGANRGLGRSYLNRLLDRGAARVYAASRDPETIEVTDTRIVPIRCDITNPTQVAAAAQRCDDVTVLINNAGVMLRTPLLAAPDTSAARSEMDTNYFGTLAMCRAFAPILANNGGGALVNVLSVASWQNSAFNGSYGASKSAEWALTNAIRIELRSAGTLVVGVHAGWIDTDMAATVNDAKLSTGDVVEQSLHAVENGDEEVIAGDWAHSVKQALAGDLSAMYADLQQQWDSQRWPWKR